MFGKTRIKLMLLMSVISVVVSCLVTNCPRGGKRGESNFYSNYLSDVRKCKFCDPDKEICSRGLCSSENCEDYGRCISPEVCCARRFCRLEMSCRGKFKLTKEIKNKQSSIILTKILTYNLALNLEQKLILYIKLLRKRLWPNGECLDMQTLSLKFKPQLVRKKFQNHEGVQMTTADDMESKQECNINKN